MCLVDILGVQYCNNITCSLFATITIRIFWFVAITMAKRIYQNDGKVIFQNIDKSIIKPSLFATQKSVLHHHDRSFAGHYVSNFLTSMVY